MISEDLRRKLAVAAARTRLADFFKMYDKTNTKKCSVANARRALSTAGCELSDDECAAVLAHYADDVGDWFMYGRFVNDFNDTKPSGFFERNPDATHAWIGTARASAFSVSPLDGGSAGYFAPLSEEEDAALQSVLDRLRELVATRGILVKQFLQDFDVHHRGTVTMSRFKREVSACFPSLSAADVDLLSKAYCTADKNDVRYMVLHNDITPAEDSARAGTTGHSLKGSSGSLARAALGTSGSSVSPRRPPVPEKLLDFMSVRADDVAAVEAAIIRQVFERRLRICDFFSDFDRTRRGIITRSQFARGLRNANLTAISPAAVETVASKYADPADPSGEHIRWVDFVNFVERAFTESELEKAPTKVFDSFAHTVVTAPHPRFVRPKLDAAATVALEAALSGIRHHIQTWRTYTLKSSLDDYDKASEGMVTETQFLRVLAMYNLVPQTTEQRAALLDYYRGYGVKTHLIDYRAFLQDVAMEGLS